MQYHKDFTVKVCLYQKIGWNNPKYSQFRSNPIPRTYTHPRSLNYHHIPVNLNWFSTKRAKEHHKTKVTEWYNVVVEMKARPLPLPHAVSSSFCPSSSDLSHHCPPLPFYTLHVSDIKKESNYQFRIFF